MPDGQDPVGELGGDTINNRKVFQWSVRQ